MMNFIKELKNLDACSGGIAWAVTQSSAQEMWNNCGRGDWMLWLCGKLSGEVGSNSRKKIVYVTCQCAKLALPYITRGEEATRIAVETAEKYCMGRVTLEEVRKAAAAAYAADAYAVYAQSANVANVAYAAYATKATNAANVVADVATDAAYICAAYICVEDEQERVIKQCAGIVREHYPVCPLKERSR